LAERAAHECDIDSARGFTGGSCAARQQSAYEKLAARAEQPNVADGEAPAPKKARGKSAGASAQQKKEDSPVGDAVEAFAKSAMRTAGSQIGRQIMRGLFESMLGSPARRKRKR
jgi:hypothetical protein